MRKRLKSAALRFELLKIGKQSNTAVTVTYLDGIADEEVLQKIKEELEKINVDCIVDSSYIAGLLAPKKHSVFKQVGRAGFAV